MKKYNVLGVNAGIGPALFPFKEHLIGAIETRGVFHTKDNAQWKLNFGDIPLYKSFQNIKERVDVIISSPDCGSGSIFRLSRAKKMGDHTKNQSLLEFFSAIQTYKPKFFLFENLTGLFKSFPPEKFIEECFDYDLTYHRESVKSWGNSQISRKRLVIVGMRKDLGILPSDFFQKPERMAKLRKTHKLLKDLPKNGNFTEPLDELIAIHGGRKMTFREIQEEWANRLDKKSRFYLKPGSKAKYKTAPGVYRNLPHKFPATARKANRQFNPQGLPMSPRELARIMGIPDDFRIYRSKIDQNLKYWINKGRTIVTKGMVYEIPLWFKLELEKIPSLKKFPS